MSAFRKIGPAIGSLSAAISPAGAAGVQLGDVRMFPPDVNPGAGWLSEHASTPYIRALDERLPAVQEGEFVFAAAAGTQEIGSLHFGGGLFVAKGTGNAVTVSGAVADIYTSSDLNSWTKVTAPQAFNGLGGIFFKGRHYLCANGDPTIYTSPDAAVWSAMAMPIGVRGFTTDGKTLVAFGNSGGIALSSDGVNWTTSSSGVTTVLRAGCFAMGMFIIVGQSGTILTSPTSAIAWTQRNSPISDALYLDVAGSKDIIVASVNDSTNRTITSTNGRNFTVRGTEAARTVKISRSNGLFWGVGTGNVQTSSDGRTFQTHVTNGSATCVAIAVGNGLIAVARAGGAFSKRSLLVSGVRSPSELHTAYTRIAA